MRLIRVVARASLCRQPVAVAVFALQVLLLFSVAAGSGMGASSLESVEIIAMRGSLGLQVGGAVGEPAGDRHAAWAEALSQAVEAYDANDPVRYFKEKAVYLELGGELFSEVAGIENDARVALYKSLGDFSGVKIYRGTAELPATMWLLTASKGILAPFGWIPGVSLPDQLYGVAEYNAAVEECLWFIPVIAVCVTGAAVHKSGRLIDRAPVRPAWRMIVSSGVVGACAALSVVVAYAPSMVLLTLRNGAGSLAHPLVYIEGQAIFTTTVGAILAERLVLIVLLCLVASLLSHLFILLTDVPATSLLALVCMFVAAWYCSSYGAGAGLEGSRWLPFAYIDACAATKAYEVFPKVPQDGTLTFGSGVVCLCITLSLLLLAVTIATHMRREGSGGSRGGGALRGSGNKGARLYGEPAHRVTYIAKTILASPLYLLAVVITIGMAVAPLVTAVDVLPLDMRRDYVRASVLPALRQKKGELQGGESSERDAMYVSDLHAALFEALNSDTDTGYCRALARYERLRADHADDYERLIGVSATSASERAAFLEQVAKNRLATLYDQSSSMPACIYIAQLIETLPSLIWLLVPFVSCTGACAVLRRGKLLQSAPCSAARWCMGAALSICIAAIIGLLASLAAAGLVAIVRNGWGCLQYPVLVTVQGGMGVRPVYSQLGLAALSYAVLVLGSATAGAAAARVSAFGSARKRVSPCVARG